MTRKKMNQETEPIVVEKTQVKKTAAKKAKLKVEDAEPLQIESELPTLLEDTDFSRADDDSVLAKDYSIEDLMEAIEKRKLPSDNKVEEVSDEILERFDKTLEEKGLGDAYFQKKEKQLKEMELEHELHEFAIDEMLNE